ncbi:MAG: redoxin domain-containing protein [Candidatus Mycalebacterium zealandia]|nr:MAG: redoxin domain-containing protein [Candidatus Mycalebacterium zealandia]
MSDKLKIGDSAPLFEAETYGGEKVSLTDVIAGGGVALCFYPRDNTPGCTREACSLRDTESRIAKKGITVLGISTDSVKSHEGFRDRQKLNYTLISDKDRKIINAYGVVSPSNSARRVSFLVDREGKVRHIWKKVDTHAHGDEILNKIEELSL